MYLCGVTLASSPYRFFSRSSVSPTLAPSAVVTAPVSTSIRAILPRTTITLTPSGMPEPTAGNTQSHSGFRFGFSLSRPMLTASLSCIPVSTRPRPSSLSANSLAESDRGAFGFAVSLALPLPEFSHASAKTTGKAMKKLLMRVRLLDVITSSGSSACPCNRALSADLMEFLLVTRNGLADHLRCHLALLPSEDLDPPAFEILVDMEEVLHLLQIMLRKVGNVEVPMVVRVVARHRQD